MTYRVTTQQFEGPLGLLLALIEKRELDISQVSLASITEEYVAHLERVQDVAPHELADFLVVASKLLYLKSKALLPDLMMEDEDDGVGLADQLRMYKKFAQAAERLSVLFSDGFEGYAAPRQNIEAPAFSPPPSLSGDDLVQAFRGVVERLLPYLELPKRLLERTATVEERIVHLKRRIAEGARVLFHEMAEHGSRAEMVTSFLALLELLKQKIVHVEQRGLFEDIAIERV